jgi:hypothetical protein
VGGNVTAGRIGHVLGEEPDHQFDPAIDAELVIEACKMGMDGMERDLQLASDCQFFFFRRQTHNEQSATLGRRDPSGRR